MLTKTNDNHTNCTSLSNRPPTLNWSAEPYGNCANLADRTSAKCVSMCLKMIEMTGPSLPCPGATTSGAGSGAASDNNTKQTNTDYSNIMISVAHLMLVPIGAGGNAGSAIIELNIFVFTANSDQPLPQKAANRRGRTIIL
jgi:hypothetical protein